MIDFILNMFYETHFLLYLQKRVRYRFIKIKCNQSTFFVFNISKTNMELYTFSKKL